MSGRMIIRNSILMYGAELFSKFFQFAFIILLTRYAGVGDYGKIAYALSLGWIILTVADFGINGFLLRDISFRLNRSHEYLSKSLGTKILLGALTLMLVFLSAAGSGMPTDKMIVLLIISLSFITDTVSGTLRVALIAHNRMLEESFVKITVGLSKLLLLLVAMLLDSGLFGLTSIYALSSIIILAVSVAIVKRKVCPVSASIDVGFARKMMSRSSVLLIAALSSAVMLNLDVLLLSWLRGDIETGLYSAPSRLIMNGLFISEIAVSSVYPFLVAFYRKSRKDFLMLSGLMSKTIMVLFMPVLLVSLVFHERIVRFIFGTEFVGASYTLGIVSFSLFIHFYIVYYGHLYIIQRKAHIFAIINVFALIMQLMLGFWLVSWYGALGAGISFIASYLLFALLCHAFLRSWAKMRLSGLMARSLSCVIILLPMLYYMRSLHLVLIALILVPAYALLVFGLRIISISEIAMMLDNLNLTKISGFTRRLHGLL